MKQLIFCLSGMLFLATQVMAQQPPEPPSPPNQNVVTVNRSTRTSTNKSKETINIPMDSEQGDAEGPEKTKTFSKSYSIDKNDKINIGNQFGSIVVKTWDKNEIKFDATIKAFALTDGEAQSLLEDVSINSTKTGDLVTFKTEINQQKNGNWGSGSKNGKKWRREIKVDITVYVPSTVSLTLAQHYGNITLGDFSGPTAFDIKYGSLTGGDLNNANNFISSQYSTTKFNNINQAKIKQQFGNGLSITNIGTLDLEAQYAGVTINTIKNNGKIKLQYGRGITIGSAGPLELNAQYASVKINSLRGNLTNRQQFGKIAIESIESSAKDVTIVASYSDVSLGFSSSYSADFDATANFGKFSYGGNVTAKKLFDEKRYRSSKSYNGQIGSGGTNRLKVTSNFDNITFR
ncbi:MAG: hypothetical protein EOO90_10820 [Pedobacter sp.]|nr:MAG: hypothetical protein EOO90_10820 [Pedobacter sp.]